MRAMYQAQQGILLKPAIGSVAKSIGAVGIAAQKQGLNWRTTWCSCSSSAASLLVHCSIFYAAQYPLNNMLIAIFVRAYDYLDQPSLDVGFHYSSIQSEDTWS
jgi:hypothetical protein